jgi:hypothetical protein
LTIFDAVKFVTGGFTLVAFIVAAIYITYQSRLKNRAEIIKSAPEAQRLEAIATTAEIFNVPLEGLTKKQKESIVLEQIAIRARREMMIAASAMVVAVLLFFITVLAIVYTPSGPAHAAQESIVRDINTMKSSEELAARVGAIQRLSAVGDRAENSGVCIALMGFVKEESPRQAKPAQSELRTDIQLAVQALSRLHKEGACDAIDLSQVDLRRLNLPEATLAGAVLTNSWLDEANLAGADLAGAEMTGVKLREAVLKNANLQGTVLTAADISRADFTGATGACLKEVSRKEDARIPPEAEQC